MQMPFRRLGESEGKILSSVLRCLRLILPKKQESLFSLGSSVAEIKFLVLLEILRKSTTCTRALWLQHELAEGSRALHISRARRGKRRARCSSSKFRIYVLSHSRLYLW